MIVKAPGRVRVLPWTWRHHTDPTTSAAGALIRTGAHKVFVPRDDLLRVARDLAALADQEGDR